ncbi:MULTISPECIES: class I SAM-dependent methyltransferase [Aerosakkonema]|uniref:class I SAM-dependent methyltransferase n=1 Tax=Aerosakkonema TaxID=1246629 RepID=UPI0035BB423A
MIDSARQKARQLAHQFLVQDNPTGWFDVLYASANGDDRAVPWADMTVNPNFADWIERYNIKGEGKKALAIGCGLGDDAEELARLGFDVVAFDISPTAIAWCRQRFPNTKVNYCVADLLASPPSWQSNFDFVFESYTIQSLPQELRAQAIQCISQFVSPGGSLLVICQGRDPEDNVTGPPWPLTKMELKIFENFALKEMSFEDYLQKNQSPVRRFRVHYGI